MKPDYKSLAAACLTLLASACTTSQPWIPDPIPQFSHAESRGDATDKPPAAPSNPSGRKADPAVVVYFDNDSHELSPRAVRKLTGFVHSYHGSQWNPLIIEGHTDWSHSDEYNLNLAWRRSQSVTAELSRLGYPTSQMMKVPIGEFRPVASNTTTSGRRLNRRVVVRVNNPGNPPTGITARLANHHHSAPIETKQLLKR